MKNMKDKIKNLLEKIKSKVVFRKESGGKEVLVEVLLIVIALSMVMLFKTQIIGMATNVFEYCEDFITSNFSTQTETGAETGTEQG